MKNKKKSFFYTLIALILATILFEVTPLDIVFQEFFYSRSTSSWLIGEDDKVLRLVFYTSARILYISLVLFLLFTLIFFRKLDWVKNNYQGLIIVVISCFLIPVIITLIKNHSHIPCPDQLFIFNGSFKHTGLFEILGEKTFSNYIFAPSFDRYFPGCFPAGHSSGGFSLLSLLFLFKSPMARKAVLFFVMVFAWSISFYKIAVGDHFLSHSLTTMFIAWLMILIIVEVVEYLSRLKDENLHQE